MQTNVTNPDDVFFQEYTSGDAIRKYTRATAGVGISTLLDRDYKAVYLRALDLLPSDAKRRPLKILEFGCGGGMNLLHLMSVLRREGYSIERAVGADFSPVLIEAAKKEAGQYLKEEDRQKVQFSVAKNETLLHDLSGQLGQSERELENSYQFVLGVNTIRYCHRAGTELDCARDIFRLLMPGGVCVVIDMNDRFPVFRSALRNKLTGKKERAEECYLPSLQEYTAPFEAVGFNVLRSEHFCWIPHSAGPLMTGVMRTLSPALSAIAGSRAMRSLVVAQKPLATEDRRQS